jgi:hypothetical protein
MSKGPGRIERAIAAILDAEPEDAFTLDELCRRIFDLDLWDSGVVRPKHSISVARAGKKLCQRRRELGWSRIGVLVFHRRDNLMSLAVAARKATRRADFRAVAFRDAQAILASAAAPPDSSDNRLSKNWDCERVSRWRQEMDLCRAELEGDTATIARIGEEREVARERLFRQLGRRV